MNVPSGYTALDLIGFTDRGDYDSTANYVKNDLVHHNNSIWRCLVDDTTAVTPAEGANWTVYIQNGTTLNGMADVNLTTPANGDLLRYNSTSSKWENQDVDSTPTQSSTKLVQSGGVYTQLAGKADTADLATVATTGAYSDLSGAPQLAAVATSGAYSDLTGQPTIPTVNDATLTIQKNGTNVETFTANSSTNKTANITVPDVINDLSDVNISSVANEEILAYDSTLSKWKNSGALGALKETFTNQINYNGAKNLFKTPFVSFENTYANVLFKVITDAITLNGTATSSADIPIYPRTPNRRDNLYLPNGEYIYTIHDENGDIINDGSLNIYVGTTSGGAFKRISNNTSTGINTFTIDDSFTYDYVNEKGEKLIAPYIWVLNGKTYNNKYVKFMLRLASDTDNTYTPYAKTNQQLTQETTGLISNEFANGAVNLLENKATSLVMNGVTFTVNSDGSVNVNGTATASFNYTINSAVSVKAGTKYKLSGSPSSANSTLRIYTSSSSDLVSDSGNGVIFSPANNTAIAFIHIDSGNTVSNKVFKPMLTLADMPNSDYNHYVPHAMTNKELTNVAEQIEGGYIYVGRDNVSVTGDGTKTYSQLFAELYNAFANYLSENQNSYIKLVSFGGSASSIILLPRTYAAQELFNKSTKSYELKFSQYDIVLDTNRLFGVSRVAILNSNASNCKYCYDTQQNTYVTTFTDSSDGVISSGSKRYLLFDVYKKIS